MKDNTFRDALFGFIYSSTTHILLFYYSELILYITVYTVNTGAVHFIFIIIIFYFLFFIKII